MIFLPFGFHYNNLTVAFLKLLCFYGILFLFLSPGMIVLPEDFQMPIIIGLKIILWLKKVGFLFLVMEPTLWFGLIILLLNWVSLSWADLLYMAL